MSDQTTIDFCQKWLKSWTGNRPDILIQYYHPEILYKDPANRNGIQGRENLFNYLEKLLAKNPDWQWDLKEFFPIESGFCLKWLAHMPSKQSLVVVEGMDILELKNQLIIRNEVYFDTHLIYE